MDFSDLQSNNSVTDQDYLPSFSSKSLFEPPIYSSPPLIENNVKFTNISPKPEPILPDIQNIQNIQIKNVSLPVQTSSPIIISSSNNLHTRQPSVIYTTVPIQNQHIILQQQGNKRGSSKNNGPVLVQNIQQIPVEQMQPVVLQAKIIKTDAQVSLLDIKHFV